MKNVKKPDLHLLLLCVAFTVAITMRLIRLGAVPLTDREAVTALQALAVDRGAVVLFGPNMTYVGLTGLTFFIFNASNFWARFWPSIIGSLIVFVPYLFRDRVGQWPAIVSALVLAISPEMVGLSRIIGSPIIALVCLLLAVGFWMKKKPILTGAALALGLMGGPSFWVGCLIIGISFLISEWLFKASDALLISKMTEINGFLLPMAVSFAVALLVVGTGFYLAPFGLSGIFSGLVTFIRGFALPYPPTNLLLPLILTAYTFVAILLAIWGGLRGILMKDKLDMFLFVWWVFGLIFVLLYPGGTPADLVWVTLPVWILSARVVCFTWQVPDNGRFVLILTTVLVIVVSAFMSLTSRSFVRPGLSQTQQINYLIALAGGVVLLVAIFLLISYGWSGNVARAGFLIGFILVFSASLFAISINSTGLSHKISYTLWYPEEANLSPEWLLLSIDRVLTRNSKRVNPIEIAVSDLDTPGMQWVLRDYDPVHFVPYLAPQTQPGMLITNVQELPEIANSYRGQKLVWSKRAQWEEMRSFQYLNWLITREVPTRNTEILFWVRTDLMPDG